MEKGVSGRCMERVRQQRVSEISVQSVHSIDKQHDEEEYRSYIRAVLNRRAETMTLLL